jgi:hypothetical protein
MKLKPQYATEVYLTQGGYCAIKQHSDDDYVGDNIILLSPEQISRLLPALNDALKDASTWWDVVAPEGGSDA